MTTDDIMESYGLVEMETGTYYGVIQSNNATGIKLTGAVLRRKVGESISRPVFMGEVHIPASRVYFIVNKLVDRRDALYVQQVIKHG